MRIALHADGEPGRRAGRVLLAERDLTALGLYGHSGGTEDRRTTRISALDGYDPLVTDAPDARSFASIAAEEGVSCVVAADFRVDRRLARRFLDNGITLLVSAGLAGGLAEVLAAHEQALLEEPADVRIAWTSEGRPLRRGEAVPFPDPVGPRWARLRSRLPRRRRHRGPVVSRYEAPVDGDWAGVFVEVRPTGKGPRGGRIVGVADHRDHLLGLVLAAGAISVARGDYPPGVHRPAVASSSFLQTALRIGLGVASYTEDS